MPSLPLITLGFLCLILFGEKFVDFLLPLLSLFQSSYFELVDMNTSRGKAISRE
jgi:hypothetical protein